MTSSCWVLVSTWFGGRLPMLIAVIFGFKRLETDWNRPPNVLSTCCNCLNSQMTPRDIICLKCLLYPPSNEQLKIYPLPCGAWEDDISIPGAIGVSQNPLQAGTGFRKMWVIIFGAPFLLQKKRRFLEKNVSGKVLNMCQDLWMLFLLQAMKWFLLLHSLKLASSLHLKNGG